jgi:hypothetical protein
VQEKPPQEREEGHEEGCLLQVVQQRHQKGHGIDVQHKRSNDDHQRAVGLQLHPIGLDENNDNNEKRLPAHNDALPEVPLLLEATVKEPITLLCCCRGLELVPPSKQNEERDKRDAKAIQHECRSSNTKHPQLVPCNREKGTT